MASRASAGRPRSDKSEERREVRERACPTVASKVQALTCPNSGIWQSHPPGRAYPPMQLMDRSGGLKSASPM